MNNVHYRSMMSSSDALIWDIEADPHLRSTVMSVWVLDSVPTPERMAANIDRMVAAIPRLRQRAVEGRPRPSWVATDVAVDEHYTVDALPDGSDLADALAYAERWVREPFDRRRPLWRLGLLTGLTGGRAAIVIKVHHAIADGMGMVLMLGAFTDLEPDPAPRRSVVGEDDDVGRPVYTPARRTLHKVGRAASGLSRHPVRTVRETSRTLVSAARLVMPNRTPHSRLMTARSGDLRMDTRAIRLDLLKAAGREHAASLNDAFVALVADALDRYHDRHGVRCDRLRVHMPVNIRNERTAALAGNQFVPARVTLRVQDVLGAPRIVTVRDQLARLRDEPALHHVNTVSATVQRLGKPVSRWVIGGMMKGVDVLASNVPGPPFPLYLAGARVEQFYAFGPPAGAALNVTLFSYDGVASVGITTDAAAVTERDEFLACLDAAIADGLGADAATDRTVAVARAR